MRPLSPREVLSPADGKIVILTDAVEKFYLGKKSVHIAIFMNPLNNHVQRMPFDGKVVRKVYYPGEFLAAYDDKADLVNEQCHLVMELKGGKDFKAPGRVVVEADRGFLVPAGENRRRTGRGPGAGRTFWEDFAGVPGGSVLTEGL